MKKTRKIKISKKTAVYIGVIFVFALIFANYLLFKSKYEKSLKIIQNRVKSKISKNNVLDETLKEKTNELERKIKLKNEMDELSKKRYTYKNMGKFINNFETNAKNYTGTGKISYKNTEKDKTSRINFSFKGDYFEFRRLIHSVEKEYYFLKITYIDLFFNQKEGLIEAKLEIKAYFGDDIIG